MKIADEISYRSHMSEIRTPISYIFTRYMNIYSRVRKVPIVTFSYIYLHFI